MAEGGGIRNYIFDRTNLTVNGSTLTITAPIRKPSAFLAMIVPLIHNHTPPLIEPVQAGNPLARKLRLGDPNKNSPDLGFARERHSLQVNHVEYFARAVCVKTGGTMTEVITLP